MRLDKISAIRTAVTNGATDAELLRMFGELMGKAGTSVRGILYRGPSMIDGKPIVAIATCNTNNPKTGALVQIWILRGDMHPLEALTSGEDVSICGKCPHRPNPTSRVLKSGPNKGETRTKLNRSCYVNPMGPTSVWNTLERGGYQDIGPEAFVGARIRWGAYGEPIAIPVALFNAINAVAAEHVGYTHQWRSMQGRKFKGQLMASVDTLIEETRARAAGWSTFRVGLVDGSDIGEATECPAAASKNEVTCSDCMACDGSGGASIYVAAHGQTAKLVPAMRIAAKANAMRRPRKRAVMRASQPIWFAPKMRAV